MIEVTDNFGDEWYMKFVRYQPGQREAWFACNDVISNFHLISVPVFTEWWDD